MNELERIKGTDSVADGLMKSDRNFTRIQNEFENIDVSEDIENHNTDDTSHENIIGLLSNLTTDEKANLVQAINEIKSETNEITTRDYIPITKGVMETNTSPTDYINKFKTNGARYMPAIGLPPTSYWCNVFGINSLNGDTGVSEFAVAKDAMFFRTQVGHGKIANWDGVSWKQIATTEKIEVSSHLVNGWVLHVGNLMIEKTGNICSINAIIKNGATTLTTSILTNMPTLLRPASSRVIGCFSEQTGVLYQLYVEADGRLRIGGTRALPVGENIVIAGTYHI